MQTLSAILLLDIRTAYFQKRDFDQAIKYSKELIKARTTHFPNELAAIAGAHLFLGEVLKEQGKYQEALKTFQTALNLAQSAFKPSDQANLKPYYIWMLYISDIMGQFSLSEEFLAKVYQTKDNSLENQIDQLGWKGVLQFGRGYFDAAQACFEIVCEHYRKAEDENRGLKTCVFTYKKVQQQEESIVLPHNKVSVSFTHL